MDLYKELGNAIQKNIFCEWEKVTVKIESSLKKMCSFQAEYVLSSKETKEFGQRREMVSPLPKRNRLGKID